MPRRNSLTLPETIQEFGPDLIEQCRQAARHLIVGVGPGISEPESGKSIGDRLRRYSLGVSPITRLNTRDRCAWLENPEARAISISRIDLFFISV